MHNLTHFACFEFIEKEVKQVLTDRLSTLPIANHGITLHKDAFRHFFTCDMAVVYISYHLILSTVKTSQLNMHSTAAEKGCHHQSDTRSRT